MVASELLFTALLPRPMKDGRQDLIERYLELFRNTRRFHLAPADRRVILRSVHLRADFGLRSMDALYLATALVHDCEAFVTNDQRLARVGRLRRTHPSWSERSDMLKGCRSRIDIKKSL